MTLRAPISKEAAKIGAHIRRTRRYLALSRKELAEKFGLSIAALSAMENGTKEFTRGRLALVYEKLRIWSKLERPADNKRIRRRAGRKVPNLPRKPKPAPDPNAKEWTKSPTFTFSKADMSMTVHAIRSDGREITFSYPVIPGESPDSAREKRLYWLGRFAIYLRPTCICSGDTICALHRNYERKYGRTDDRS